MRKIQEKIGGKLCSKCFVSKPFGDFPVHRYTYDKLDSWCKSCRKEYRYEVKTSLDSHVRAILSRAKDDRRKPEVNVDLQYLIDLWYQQKGMCKLSGIKMEHQRKTRKHNLYNASLDRIDSSLGYLKGNVQWVCWMVNRMKGENSIDQLVEICEKIITTQKNGSADEKQKN